MEIVLLFSLIVLFGTVSFSRMEITRTSVLSRTTRTFDLNVTVEQLRAWSMGLYAQQAFPQLTPDEREFIISGVTPEEWNAHFGTEDDEGEAVDA